MASVILDRNRSDAKKFKEILELRSEPVAIKLVREGDEYPSGYSLPEKQLSHCQAVMNARHGNKYMMPLDQQMCNVGAASLGMMDTPGKVSSGDFHFTIGLHNNKEAARKMVEAAPVIPYKVKGEIVCPLKDADFEPDSVVIVDIPERVYWIEPLFTAETGGRVSFSTAPFQCACVDVTSVPIVTGHPNISIGCFGCRKKTDIKADEMAIGIPGKLIPGMARTLERYKTDVLPKANRAL